MITPKQRERWHWIPPAILLGLALFCGFMATWHAGYESGKRDEQELRWALDDLIRKREQEYIDAITGALTRPPEAERDYTERP